MRARHPEKTVDVLRYMTEDVNNILYYFFRFIGSSTHNSDFLSEVVDRYESGDLGLMSYKEFDEWYNTFHKTDIMPVNIDRHIAEFIAVSMAEQNAPIAAPRAELRMPPEVMAHGGRRRTRKNRRRVVK